MTTASTTTQKRQAWRWALFSLCASLALMGLKWWAFWLTQSTAILSDAIESGVNILSSSFLLFAIWLSNQPRDEDHPYGHGKIEYFSSGFEGALILFAGLAIAVTGMVRMLDPEPLMRLGVGAAFEAGIGVVTVLVGWALIRAGRRLDSPSLEADGVHFRSDAITSFVTAAGVLLVWATGFVWLDALVALVLGCWLVINGTSVVRHAIGGLMDEASPELLDRIAQALEAVRQSGWLAPHHTKIHRLGRTLHIDLHMVFPAYWSIERVHGISKTIERQLQSEFGPQCEVMLHMESCTPRSCSYCDMPQCPIRQHPFIARHDWNGEQIARPHRAPGHQEPGPQEEEG